jgi:hypothetical protein
MPPLDLESLRMEALFNGQQRKLRTPTEGDATLLLTYKGYEAAVSSIAEQQNGDDWSIRQVQGARSRKSMRVASCLNWQACFANEIKQCAFHQEAEVRRLTMPHPFDITNLIESDAYESALATYDTVRCCLGMCYSDEEKMFVVDIHKRRMKFNNVLNNSEYCR